MNAIERTQRLLDRVLLPYGITSHHLRRRGIDYIEKNGRRVPPSEDEYVVFRLVSSGQKYGDGKPIATRAYIDVNYYYKYEKSDPRVCEVLRRVQAVKAAFLREAGVRLVNGESDLYDIDNPYRGINVEFSLLGRWENGEEG